MESSKDKDDFMVQRLRTSDATGHPYGVDVVEDKSAVPDRWIQPGRRRGCKLRLRRLKFTLVVEFSQCSQRHGLPTA